MDIALSVPTIWVTGSMFYWKGGEIVFLFTSWAYSTLLYILVLSVVCLSLVLNSMWYNDIAKYAYVAMGRDGPVADEHNQKELSKSQNSAHVDKPAGLGGDNDWNWRAGLFNLFVDLLFLADFYCSYDHNKYYYIGENSECVASNYDYSFQMAFGGAGYALSYPLAEALAKHLDHCLMRYTYFLLIYTSSTLPAWWHKLHCCSNSLQIDLHGDISGKLSAHPPVPLLSLHHLDYVAPIFPSMNRFQALNHLMDAAKVDSSSPLQQSICYHKQINWTFSISWGYSAQIYEKIHPPSFLEKPLQTFFPWKGTGRPHFMFHTRPVTRDPCEAPHFFFDSIEKASGSQIVSSYARWSPRMLPACSSSGNHSADHITKIRVFSPAKGFSWDGRRECCEVKRTLDGNIAEVKIRGCMKGEIVA
ncbi:hypothetical protein IFM89_026512 [Coptis chinensis]|uniref:Uncharacterized protein n=1 Tax=Coptis chinensis TaxID=261450 RepID=A0A835H6W7_9MAGN|nr:hypothetical protein IFM89_026512 [Coptis chinensis]